MRLLLVEDDTLLASGLVSALSRAGYRVDHVGDGQSAITALSEGGFDLVILDLGLPNIDGITVIERVRSKGIDLPILILSARDAVKDRIKGLDVGADDYLTKPFELDELLARIRVLERRRSGASVNLLVLGHLKLDLGAYSVTWRGHPVDLQRREFMLVRKLAENPQQIFSRDQLEESLYGWGEGVESNAIDVYVHQIRKKLDTNAIKTVRGIGYRIGDLT